MTPAETFKLLQQEGFLFQSSLTQGLTALRKANDSDPQKGNYYVAFFQLSIGLERLMKTTVIIDHMWKNNLSTPSSDVLRRLGHRLRDLYSHLQSLDGVDDNPLGKVAPTSISFDILDVLDSFARTSRYYNLDTLAAGTTASDPIDDYKQVMQRILDEDIAEKVVTRTIARQSTLATNMSPMVFAVDPAAPHESSHETLTRTLVNPALQELASRHAVYHTVVLIAALKDLIEFVVDSTHSAAQQMGQKQIAVPYMYEFLDFAWLNKSHILKKKRWP